MNGFENVIRCLGKSHVDKELIQALKQIKVDLDEDLKLPEGENRAYVSKKSKGFSLVFTDEAYFKGLSPQKYRLGPLYLSCIFIYAEGENGFNQFVGDFYQSISLRSSRDEILNQLGDSDAKRTGPDGSRVLMDFWKTIAPFRVNIKCFKTKPGVKTATFEFPDVRIKGSP